MSDKSEGIKIDLNKINEEANKLLLNKVLSIVNQADEDLGITRCLREFISGSVFKKPDLAKGVADNFEWSLSNAVGNAMAASGIDKVVSQMTDELMNDDAFKAELKEAVKLSILRRYQQ